MDHAVWPPREVIADLNSSTDARVHGDTASMQSVVLIGISSRFCGSSARLGRASSEGEVDYTKEEATPTGLGSWGLETTDRSDLGL